MKKFIYLIFFVIAALFTPETGAQITLSGAAAGNGNYSTMKAAFDTINAVSQSGRTIAVSVTGNVVESATATLAGGLWTSLTISPSGGSRTIRGNFLAPVIDLSGASNVTIDGRIGGTGSTKSLTIQNSNTGTDVSACTMRFRNGASNNTVKYCTIVGATKAANAGVLHFGTTSTTGNSNNRITNCDISGEGSGTRPVNLIYSLGSAGQDNANNSITSSNFYFFFNPTANTAAILLQGNTTAWTISGNNFYNAGAPLVPTASTSHYVICIQNTSGNGFAVDSNFIGGTLPSCGGAFFTKSNTDNNPFYGIYLSVGTTTASSIRGNTITNISYRNSTNADLCGIVAAAGAVNIGTTTGNRIGSSSPTTGVILVNAAAGGRFYGIKLESSAALNCSNNTVNGITTDNSATDCNTNFYGIYNSGAGGTAYIGNNIIGDTSGTGNLLFSPSTLWDQSAYGIYSSGSGSVTIQSNTIAYLKNATNNAYTNVYGQTVGIMATAGTNTITGNTIRNLSIQNANNSLYSTGAVSGITLTSTAAAAQTVTGNTIYNLTDSSATFSGRVFGLYYSGPTTASTVSGNFIYNLSVPGASSTDGNLIGIRIQSGVTTYANNIVSLGGNTLTNIYGIYEASNPGNNVNLYYNTIYIGGSPASGANNSYALYSLSSSNNRDFRNNIFMNARSTAGGSNLHLAIMSWYGASSQLTIDYNDYYVSGTGGALGMIGGTNTYAGSLAAWQGLSGQDYFSVNANPSLANAGGTAAANYLPSNTSLLGITGLGIATDYDGSARSATNPAMGAHEYSVIAVPLSITATSGNSGPLYYPSLKAAFYAVNLGIHKGAVTVKLNASSTETASAALNASGSGNCSYTSVNIYPAVSGLSITGSISAPLIDFSGADNVTIDGRVNASGSAKDLVISNTSTSSSGATSTIRFINDASSNTVQYCTLKGSSLSTTAGVLFFSTTNGTTGNDNNIITNNDITNAADANRPLYSVYSNGTASYLNSGNNIANNNVYNFLHRGNTSYGVFVAGNSSNWSITDNNFYETASFVPTASANYKIIAIENQSGSGYTISNNYIGGSAIQCGGTAWTKTNAFNNAFFGIYYDGAAGGTASNIQGNLITNFSWANSAAANWHGIVIYDAANIGTTAANTVGAASGNGSITVTQGGSGATFYGLYASASENVSIQNITVASITLNTSNSTHATHFYGLYLQGSGSYSVLNAVIGNSSTANSIYANSASSANTQNTYGIYSAASGTNSFQNTVIANITNSATGTGGQIAGIYTNAGANTISGNTVRYLTIANTNTGSNVSASVLGIVVSTAGSGDALETVTNNKIDNLSNTNVSFSGSVYGMYYSNGGRKGPVGHNFIHSLSVHSSTTSATIYGMMLVDGWSHLYNNIILLGGDTKTTIYGIWETGGYLHITALYYNTVYIFGTLPSGATNKSFVLSSESHALQSRKEFKNNLFVNTRSTPGGSSLHYAARYAYVETGYTINYNDYLASGAGGMLAYCAGSDVNSVPTYTYYSQDGNSYNRNPYFTNPGGTTPADYTVSVFMSAPGISEFTTDYFGNTRLSPSSVGAIEVLSPVLVTSSGGATNHFYATLKAAFDSLNAGVQTGNIAVKIAKSTTETASATLNASGTGGANYSAVDIYPTSSGISISGNLNAPLIELNGADNVTIDGRVNLTGSTASLTITNTSSSPTAGTSTVRFYNNAQYDTVQYCTIKGSSTALDNGGVVCFNTGAAGNNNNAILYNNITAAADNARPYAAISVTSGINNTNAVRNNNIYNYSNSAASSYGIYLNSSGSAWEITNNNFYETASIVPTADNIFFCPIYINNTSGSGFTISGNNIGGSAANCGGTAWTKTNAFNDIFTGIYLNAATTTLTSIQGNTIKNISFANSGGGNFYGINVSEGQVAIGTVSANVIGSAAGTGSITLTSGGTSAGTFYGIYTYGLGAKTITNNTIGAITTNHSNSAYACHIFGIYNQASGTVSITNNTFGSTVTENSINAASAATGNSQLIWGITNSGNGTVSVSNNVVAKVTNSTTNTTTGTTGGIKGIYAANFGTNTISNNTVRDLKCSNANNASNIDAAVIAIAMTSTKAAAQSVYGNTIKYLSNSFSTFSGSLIGVYYAGPTTASSVYTNFISNISITGTGGTNGSVYGIKTASGTATYYNNIISLGDNYASDVYGLYESGAAGNNNSVYFNTVYLGGSPSSGNKNSYALYSAGTVNTRNFRNNALTNFRANNGASGKHYAVACQNTANLTINYNDYYTQGEDGVTGYLSWDRLTLSDWKSATGQDANSISSDPAYRNAGDTAATSYMAQLTLRGITISGITTDYSGTTRTATPSMGAFEVPLIVVNSTGGTTVNYYTTIKGVFDAVNAGTHTGSISVKVNSDITETASATLNQSGTGSASYTALNLFPTRTGISISGSLAAPLFNLNGAGHVIIDGSVNASGTDKSLTITNTSSSTTAGTATIRFINDASDNTVKNCVIKGSTLAPQTNGGIINFGTALNTGNKRNLIENNDITCASEGNRPLLAINSYGTSLKLNSETTIRTNNIFNVFNPANASTAINIGQYSQTFDILGNSVYDTASGAPTAAVDYKAISVSSTEGGINFTINSNYIGGRAAQCGGSAMTKTGSAANSFYGIYFNGDTAASVSNIHGNTIQNISHTNSANANWYGIYVQQGKVKIGSRGANSIGSGTATGSITYITTGSTPATFYGVYCASVGVDSISNNIIGAITTGSASFAKSNSFYGIYHSAASSCVIANNTIGSSSVDNSIHAGAESTPHSKSVYGIYWDAAATKTIANNTIAGIINSDGIVSAIYSNAGTSSINNNNIYNLTANRNASITGITLASSTAAAQTIAGNSVHDCTLPYASYTGTITAINYSGPSTQSAISKNFISNLAATGSSTASAREYGIRLSGGIVTVSNNIIGFMKNSSAGMYGIYDSSGTGTFSIYFNTVTLGGTSTSGAANSSAFYSGSSANTRTVRDNIFQNLRNNSGATGKHYTAYFNYAVNTNLVLDNNDYYNSGSGTVLGYYAGANKTSLPIVTGNDSASINVAPELQISSGVNSSEFRPSRVLPGVAVSGITTDYAGTGRASTPTIGAFEVSKITVTASNAGGSYTTLKAAFDAVNAAAHTGAITIRINASTTESATAVLLASGAGGNYSSVQMYPALTGLSVSGNFAAPLIDLNGADNVTIDGRVNATGSVKDLTLVNSSSSAANGTSTIRLQCGASSNTVKYCTIKGSSTAAEADGGVIFFSGSCGTQNTGNSITENNITINSGYALNLLNACAVSGAENNGITISNNNFYNFVKSNAVIHAINISSFTNNVTITGNSFYQPSAFSLPSANEYRVIQINYADGSGYVISGNYIGGTGPLCSGTWNVYSGSNLGPSLTGIYVNASGSSVPVDIQGNVMKNILWENYNAGTITGIHITGSTKCNIGTTAGNFIGDSTSTGSITFLNWKNWVTGKFYGIYYDANKPVAIRNNVIGSIKTGINATSFNNFYGIYISPNAVSAADVSYNTIGSRTVSNSITTADYFDSSPLIYGILSDGTAANTFVKNIVSNLRNTNGSMNGILTRSGMNTIDSNTVRNLSTIGGSSICAIEQDSRVNGHYLRGNVVSGLSTSFIYYTNRMTGIYIKGYAGNDGNTTTLSGNFVHSFSTVNNSNVNTSFYGIQISEGSAAVSNNIVSLGSDAKVTIYGIYETGSPNTTRKLYFNSVYVFGSPAAGITNPSYAYFGDQGPTSVRDVRNNLFFNARSTSGGVNLHYSAYANYAASVSYTMNYNDYYVTGTGSMLGYYNSTRAATIEAWRTLTAANANSKAVHPFFANAGGTNATDYRTSSKALVGQAGTGTVTDYFGALRLSNPTMGALEDTSRLKGVQLQLRAMLQGFSSGYTMIPDTVIVRLHNGVNYTELERQTGVLSDSGKCSVDFMDYGCNPDSSYYISILHRNQIETWSALPMGFSSYAGAYDFTAAQSQAYGNNLFYNGSKWCLYSGDVNQDGIIDFSDLSAVDNASNNYLSGYVPTDVTGDQFVDFSDLSICDNNSNAFIMVQKPAMSATRKTRTMKSEDF